MKKVCFFLQTSDHSIIQRTEFYKIDAKILSDLGFEVKYCFSYKKIPVNVDFYFIWWWTYAIFPVLMAKIQGKKSLITGTFNLARHVEGADYYSRPRYQKFLIRQSARQADMNILVSLYEFTRMQKEISSGNVYYSPHVLDLKKYKIAKVNRRENYIFTIAWMGKLNAQRKCIPKILEAVSILKSQGSKLEFYIAGKMEPEAEYLIALADQLGVHDRIHFVGAIDHEEKIKHLQKCGIYLQPSMYEGFGLAIAEALLYATPLITSRVGAVPEVTGDNCYYTECSAESIAKSVNSVFNNYDYYLGIAERGRTHVVQNFPYERRLQDIRKLLVDAGIL